MNSFEQSAKRIIDNYCNLVMVNGFSVTKISKLQYNYEFSVIGADEKVKVQVYFGKKGNKTVLQGNREAPLFLKLDNLINGEKLFKINEDEFKEPEVYIGTDESGKGDYFGPLVIAGVLVDKKTSTELKNIGVKDSKELTESSISKISLEIKKIVKNKSDIIVITPEKYNELYDKFKNLNRLLGWAHAKVLENILSVHKAPEAISDKFGDESYITNSLQAHGQKIILHQQVRAEKFTAVAAASILARNRFNEWFERKNNELNVKLLKGSSQQVELLALDIKNKYGNEFLTKLVKYHFKTSKKLNLM